jgi:hypothetical protein
MMHHLMHSAPRNPRKCTEMPGLEGASQKGKKWNKRSRINGLEGN